MLSIVKTVLKGLIPIGAGLLLLCISGVSPVSAAGPGEYGIIESARLNIRPKPSNKVAPIDVLKKGTRVEVLARVDGWLRISHGKTVGYIRNRKRYVHLFKERDGKTIALPDADGERSKKAEPPGNLKKAKEGAAAKAKREATKKAKQEAAKKAKQEAAKKAKQEAEIKAKKEAEQAAVKKAKSESEKIGRSIKKQEAEVARYGKKEEMIINGLNEIDLSMDRVGRRIKAVEAEIAALDKQILEIEGRSRVLEKEMAADEKYVARRIEALYRLKLIGKFNLLASSETLHEFAFRKKAMETILAGDARLLDTRMQKSEELSRLSEKLGKTRGEKATLQEAHAEEARIMSVEKRKRRTLLSDIRSKKALSEAAVASLREQAKKLNDVIGNMAETLDSHVKTAKQHKRLLRLPVKGKIISTFGPAKDSRFDVVTFQSGINIRSDRGEPVQAVKAGRVLYARWFKGYGNMIIIDHGESYYTLYAHAQELFKKNGESVEEREVIATVGETGSMDGVKLHFEVRHHGKPIDPLKWLKNG